MPCQRVSWQELTEPTAFPVACASGFDFSGRHGKRVRAISADSFWVNTMTVVWFCLLGWTLANIADYFHEPVCGNSFARRQI